MTLLLKVKKVEGPFFENVERANTGDTIFIGPPPPGLDRGVCLAHMDGVLTLVDDNLYLNNTLVCATDNRVTNGKYFPFFHDILIYRPNGRTLHEFFWIRPSNVSGHDVPEPAFFHEAENLTVEPLTSGKGIFVMETAPMQRMFLLKKGGWLKRSEKKVLPRYVTWVGDYARRIMTPTSVVVARKTTAKSGMSFIQLFRGHHQKPVFDYPGTDLPNSWATDDDFFYQGKVSGEDVIISARTGQPVYYGDPNEATHYVTKQALVRRKGTVVEANGVEVTNKFQTESWILEHGDGLIYTWRGKMEMLVIKGVPKK